MNNKGDRYTFIAGGTSRNICKATCQPLLETDGLTLGGPIYNGEVTRRHIDNFGGKNETDY